MFNGLFRKPKYITVNPNLATQKSTLVEEKTDEAEQKPNIPNGMWVKCEACGSAVYKKDLDEALMVCKCCNMHFRMNARERIDLVIDEDTFTEFDETMTSMNPLNYPNYEQKLSSMKEQTGLNEAVVTGRGKIDGIDTVIAVMDSRFMMASMGSVVGEKITRAVEKATESRLPIVIFTASGGARMQEGIVSLMQMAKVSAALARHDEAGLLYVTVLTDPTTGGVTASFAMLGDIIIAEPKALIGFAGKRVIEQTIKQKLPDEFQKSEFLLEHGFIDKIVERKDLKQVLGNILSMHRS